MNRNLRCIAILVVVGFVRPTSALAQEQAGPPILSSNGGGPATSLRSLPAQPLETDNAGSGSPATRSGNSASSTASGAKARAESSQPHRFASLNVTVNWRFRTEAWDFFEPSSGQNAYAFEHSLLRIGIGQKRESFEWFLEGAQDAILNLPTRAVVSAPQGQLGLGGSYYAANGNGQYNANGFVRQAYVGFKLPENGNLRVGRFTFLDGAEVAPKDRMLATVVNSRITQRLIGDFGFSAVGRSFDGALLSMDAKGSNFTLLGARPTRGVNQIDAMGEVDVDLFYGAYTLPVNLHNGAGQLRVFAAGYVDERASVLKTDNRPQSLRATDHEHIRVGTYGADYAHVFHTQTHGDFDFVVWGVLQNGSWGALDQKAGAFVGEAGWQAPWHTLRPWFSAGYSYGSGDSNPNDSTHGTFFQLLPTPRPYARFPFYNMMNNKDYYGTAVFRLPHAMTVRSELHALRLASSHDFWYSGGGAFQPKTFGYTGRATSGNGSLANVWDVSWDVPLRYGFTLTTYYAHAWGKDAVASIYPGGSNAQFGYVETNFHF